MLEDLIKLVDDKELKSFMRHARITKPAKYDIAEKNAIVTREAASSLSKSVAAVHTALNVIAATTQNRNNIEKARLERLDTSTKENYMEARKGRGTEVTKTTQSLEIAGVVKALAAFNNLLEDLDDALKKLDLSCNICYEPCEPDLDRKRVKTRTRVRARTRVKTRTRVRARTVARAQARATVEVGQLEETRGRVPATKATPRGLPAPPRTAPPLETRLLTSQPLPDGEAFREATKPREKVAVEAKTAAKEATKLPKADTDVIQEGEGRGRTVAEWESFKQSEEKIAREMARRADREARRLGAQPVTEAAPGVRAPEPRARWTANVPKEQYFEELRRRFVRSPPPGSSGGLPATVPSAPNVKAGPSWFDRATAAGKSVLSKGRGFFSGIGDIAAFAGVDASLDYATQNLNIDRMVASGQITKAEGEKLKKQNMKSAATNTATNTAVGFVASKVLPYIGRGIQAVAPNFAARAAPWAAKALSGATAAAALTTKALIWDVPNWLITNQQTQGYNSINESNKIMKGYGIQIIPGPEGHAGPTVNTYSVNGKTLKYNQLSEYHKKVVDAYNPYVLMAEREGWNKKAQDEAKAARNWLKTGGRKPTQTVKPPTGSVPPSTGGDAPIVVTAKRPSKPKAAKKVNGSKATQQLTNATKKVLAGQKAAVVNQQKSTYASLTEKFANFINDAMKSISDYVSNLSSTLTGFGDSALSIISDLGDSITNTYYRMSGNIRENFKNIMYLAAKYGDPHPELTAAQWAAESGYGKHMSGRNNPFGQMATASQPGSYHRDNQTGRVDKYRDYDSLEEAIKEHVVKWNLKHTKAGQTPAEALQAIINGGYNPYSSYKQLVLSVLTSNNIDPTRPFMGIEDAIKQASDRSLAGQIVNVGSNFIDTIQRVSGNITGVVRVASNNVSLNGLRPGFLRRFQAMASEYYNRTGNKITVNSAYRSFAQQAELYRMYGPPRAAPPGGSRHEVGLAIDISSSDGEALQRMGLLSKYGLIRPIASEPWHVEPVESRNGQPLPDNPYKPGGAIAAASKNGAVNPASGKTVAAPAKGGYLLDVVTGAAASRRVGARPKVVMIPLMVGAKAAPSTAFLNRPKSPTPATPSPAAQYRRHIAGK